MKEGIVVKLSGINMNERLQKGIKQSLNVLESLDCCEVIGFKDSYELKEFEDVLNTILGYNEEFKDKKYLRTANEEELNYNIQKQ